MSINPDFTKVALPDHPSCSYDEWKKNLEEKMGENYDALYDTTLERIPKAPLYTKDIYDKCNHLDFMSGIPPFLRGPYSTMYVFRPWTVRQYAGFSTAEESNAFYRRNLAAGQKGLSIAFDLPTHRGYDADNPRVVGDVGKAGVSVCSMLDMNILFSGIPLDQMSVSMTMNGAVLPVLAFFIVSGEEQGVDKSIMAGTIQNDILKEYAARGTYIFPPKPSMRLITNIFEYCSKNVPLWNTISISGYHIREAGSTASQEIAFTIADGIAYVEAAIKAGLDVDAFAGRLSFFWNAHNNVLEEVAKFRASRRVWSKVMKERFGAKKAKSMMLRVHTQTAGSMLTAQQPNNNIVRVALQTAAAVMGGTQSLHTNSKDEALALPTTESVTIALRTQQIVAYESGLADTIDPLGGSYYVEALTDKIEAEAWEYIKKIDEIGGAPEAIAKGYIQKEIQDSAYKWQMEIEKGDRIIVGVNKFTQEEEAPKNLLRVDGSVGKLQAEKIAALKARRDNAKVEETLAALKVACADENVNLMPYILNAVRAYATEGEICGVMRQVFGEYQPHTAL